MPRITTICVQALALLLLAVAAPKADAIAPEERVLGSRDAPVTIIEYSSLTCPHCAEFHRRTLPRLLEAYIDTGKVKLVYRDFPLDRTALLASAVARCAPAKRYFRFLEVLFRDQEQWSGAPSPQAELVRIGRQGGLAPARLEACLGDEALADAILAERLEGERIHGVTATPTFIIDGKGYRGALTFEEFATILAPLVPPP